MAVRVGVNTAFGAKSETTWGTPEVVDRFWEVRSEGLQHQKETIVSQGLRSGRRNLNRSGAYSQYSKGATGDLVLEWQNQSMAWWLLHLMGALAAPVESPTDVFSHVGSIASLTGSSFTCQFDKDGVPFTYSGCKVATWSLECALDELLVATVNIMAKDEVATRSVTDGVTTNASPTVTSATARFHSNDVGKSISGAGIPAGTTIIAVVSLTEATMSANATATATGVTVAIGTVAETAVYPTDLRPMSFVHGQITVAGVATDITSFSLSCDNNLPERWFFGAINKEPLDQGRTIEGSFDSEFEDLAIYQRFLNGEEASIVLVFTSDEEITPGNPYSLTINIPSVRFDGETPNVDGPDIITQTSPFTVLNDDMTITVVNGDAAA